jgi:hypothetical protein
MFWFVTKKKYDALEKRYMDYITFAQNEINRLNQELKEAKRNDHRDKKGRFTKAKG